jgi:hypothetical protein
MTADPKLKAELKKQLQVLANSCRLYDEGHIEEGVRIAATIRVLVHDTSKSTSLLKLMDAKGIQLATSAPARNPNVLAFSGTLSIINVRTDNPVGGPPIIDAVCLPRGDGALAAGRTLDVDAWWEEIIYLFLDGAVSRKQLVLAGANKDGGAHVDDLPPMYERLKNSTAGAQVEWTDANGTTCFSVSMFGPLSPNATPVRNFQYADLRQMATELLGSPELLALTV